MALSLVRIPGSTVVALSHAMPCPRNGQRRLDTGRFKTAPLLACVLRSSRPSQRAYTVHVRLVFSFRMNSLSTEIILVNDYTSDVVFDI